MEHIIENRMREIACYRQFPEIFEFKFGQVLEHYLSAYFEKADITVLSKNDIEVAKDLDSDLFAHVFGYEPGFFCLNPS